MNPPSPWTGSSTMQATASGVDSDLKSLEPAIASLVVTPRYGYGPGERYTSGAKGRSRA